MAKFTKLFSSKYSLLCLTIPFYTLQSKKMGMIVNNMIVGMIIKQTYFTSQVENLKRKREENDDDVVGKYFSVNARKLPVVHR